MERGRPPAQANPNPSPMKPHHSNQARHFSLIAGIRVAAWGFMTVLVMALAGHPPHPPSPPRISTPRRWHPRLPPAGGKSRQTRRQRGPRRHHHAFPPIGADRNGNLHGLGRLGFPEPRRTLDPFGMPQDPDAKPIVKAPVPEQSSASPRSGDALSGDHRKIVVTTIMPGEKRFLVGTRSIKQGEHIPLIFRGKQIRVASHRGDIPPDFLQESRQRRDGLPQARHAPGRA